MRMKLSVISVGLIALAGSVQAQDAQSMFSFSGFGTVGTTVTNTDDATFRTTYQKDGATTNMSLGPDSKVALQMNASFNSTFSATAQLLSKQDALGSYDPKLEWGFVKAKMGSNFSLRAGRMGAPFFMTSDYRNVGYTNLSVRTPPDVYYAVPVSTFDGADVLYQGSFGDTTMTGQIYTGKSSTEIGKDQTILLNDVLGFNMSAEFGSTTLRFGHVETVLGTAGSGIDQFNTLIATLGQASKSPQLPQNVTSLFGSLASNLAIYGKKASFTGVGLSVDLGNVVASAEVTKRKTDSLYVSDISAWYTTVGYRMNKVTPYLSLSSQNVDSITSVTSPIPQGIVGAVDQLIGAVNQGALTNNTQKTTAVGARWEAGKSYALKGELAMVAVPAGSSGIFSNLKGPNVKGGRFATDTNINVFSVGVDFVF